MLYLLLLIISFKMIICFFKININDTISFYVNANMILRSVSSKLFIILFEICLPENCHRLNQLREKRKEERVKIKINSELER